MRARRATEPKPKEVYLAPVRTKEEMEEMHRNGTRELATKQMEKDGHISVFLRGQLKKWGILGEFP